MTAEAPSSSLHAIWRVTRLLLVQPELRATAASSLLLGLAASFVLPFFSLFGTREVGMSLGEFGAFMTATAVANIVITTVLSHRSDALYSRRALLLIGSAAGAVGYVGYAYARDLWALLVIGGVVMGVASLTFSQLFAHARELVDRSESARPEAALYLSAIRMCFALAWTVGPAVAALLLDVFSSRSRWCSPRIRSRSATWRSWC